MADKIENYSRGRSRHYDPTIGRWTTKDPIGFNGGDTNLYAYVGGNPMSYTDPTGLFAEGYFAGRLTPAEQGTLAASLAFFGANLGAFGAGTSATIFGVPIGGPALVLSGALLFEATTNGSKAWKRAHTDIMDSFDNQSRISLPGLPFTMGMPNQNNTNGALRCPASN